MAIPNQVAVLTPDASPAGAGLALLDRCLAGYPRDGVLVERIATDVVVYGPPPGAEPIERRRRDYRLNVASTLEAAVSGADGVVVVPVEGNPVAPVDWMDAVLNRLKPGASCFVAGLVAARAEDARRLTELAKRRGVRLGAGGLLSYTFRLPETRTRGGRRVEGLIVVRGEDAVAKADGVLGLIPEIDPMPAGPDAVTLCENDAVWAAGARGDWSWDLLAAALSRSNNALGDAVVDGRTQDLVGLGLVQRLAKHPRAWITEHADGVRSTILALDGVVNDVNLAVRDRSRVVHSFQLYRPPAPNLAGYHRLMAVIHGFLTGAALPWPERKLVESSAWWEALA